MYYCENEPHFCGVIIQLHIYLNTMEKNQNDKSTHQHEGMSKEKTNQDYNNQTMVRRTKRERLLQKQMAIRKRNNITKKVLIKRPHTNQLLIITMS